MKSRWAILTILVVLAAGLLFAGQSYPAPQGPPECNGRAPGCKQS